MLSSKLLSKCQNWVGIPPSSPFLRNLSRLLLFFYQAISPGTEKSSWLTTERSKKRTSTELLLWIFIHVFPKLKLKHWNIFIPWIKCYYISWYYGHKNWIKALFMRWKWRCFWQFFFCSLYFFLEIGIIFHKIYQMLVKNYFRIWTGL